MRSVIYLMLIVFSFPSLGWSDVENTVEKLTIPAPADQIVKHHPRTGKPYKTITSPDSVSEVKTQQLKGSRPNYHLLDSNVKNGEIDYDGPYSSRKKVYLLAAGLATLGVAGGAAATAGIGVCPMTGVSAVSSTSAYTLAGTSLAAGGVTSALIATNDEI